MIQDGAKLDQSRHSPSNTWDKLQLSMKNRLSVLRQIILGSEIILQSKSHKTHTLDIYVVVTDSKHRFSIGHPGYPLSHQIQASS